MTLTEPISNTIWNLKYRYRRGGEAIDKTIEDTWRRVAFAIAAVEQPSLQKHWQQEFYSILSGFKYLPGGRILAGAGTSFRVTLFNCFVMNIAEDSLRGIFNALREGALTLQQGGGVGYDFSVLRPYGDLVKKTGLPASGPVSFMRIWDTTCSILLSTGARRGAMMGVLRCDHPDIEAFVAAKANTRELRHFNVSVMVSDAFMQAVRTDDDWPLIFPAEGAEKQTGACIYREWGALGVVPCRIYKVIKARTLWRQIIRSAYDYAEPGVLFADTINRENNLWYRERLAATNPCGEIPLPPYGACNLGAINLTQFVLHPFQSEAGLDWKSLERTVQIATRFQDNVIDVSHYPLKAQLAQAQGTRRIGLGLTGLADALVMLGIKYGSTESLALASKIMQKIATVTWQTSIALAQEKGPFPFMNQEYLRGKFVESLSADQQQAIAKFGIRNSHHNTIAPAGTISLLANNISNGIEPIFLGEYNRHVRTGSQEKLTFSVRDYALAAWQENHKGLPDSWVDTSTLSPQAHLLVQAAMQPYIDNAISKTINIPADYPFEKLEEIYSEAFKLKLKGCTIFRPNPVTGSVLEAPNDPASVDHCCQNED